MPLVTKNARESNVSGSTRIRPSHLQVVNGLKQDEHDDGTDAEVDGQDQHRGVGQGG
jgi:hypothetical protein